VTKKLKQGHTHELDGLRAHKMAAAAPTTTVVHSRISAGHLADNATLLSSADAVSIDAK
jgi:hypothetical protein